MFRAVEVQNSSPAVFDAEDAVKSLELQCGNREEVEGGDDLAMVVEECEPPLSLILLMSSLQTLQVAKNRWFGHVEPELAQFAMDARRSPAGFSAFTRRISSRISRVILGRPGWRDLHRQNRWKPARCQDTTVSGLTKMSESAQSEYSHRSVVQKSRSARLSLGRGCFVLKRASCCRRAAASKASLWPGTKNARMYVTTANMSEPIAPILSN